MEITDDTVRDLAGKIEALRKSIVWLENDTLPKLINNIAGLTASVDKLVNIITEKLEPVSSSTSN